MAVDGVERVAFITGAAAGFGRAFAQALAEDGAAVVIADINVAGGKAAAVELTAAGHRALAVACDVADETSVEAAVAETVATFGGVDILINNAGLHLTKYNQPFGVLPRSDLRSLFEVNIVGVVNCSLACQASMRERGGGSIVSLASIAGYRVTSPYGVSKLAVRGLTMALATEFAPDRIRVNAIAPGLMATENAIADLPEELVSEFVDNLQLVHRVGSPDDIVKTMMWLCSDAATFITGETIKVSGGYPLGI
jgi:3-oxoacyl-[acyl-carrier protein] reductase